MATRPEAKRSFRASTSVVTRVTRRPTGCLVVIAHGQALQVVENFLAHVAHGFLADALHHSHLQILETETENQRRQEYDADPAERMEPLVVGHFVVRDRQNVFVGGDLK
jgi:hypothetical protein